MAHFPGGLRFRHVNISGHGTRDLLEACRERVETLELSVDDICGEQPL